MAYLVNNTVVSLMTWNLNGQRVLGLHTYAHTQNRQTDVIRKKAASYRASLIFKV